MAKWLKIMQAAVLLDYRGFPLQALVVAAWNLDREAFGIKGYRTQYPDSNHVMTYLYGHRGLVARGYLVRVGNLYAVTDHGRNVVRDLQESA